MKLKYILFLGLMFLISIMSVEAATCKYGNSDIYVDCKTSNDGKANCSLGGGAASGVSTFGYVRPSNNIIERCDYVYIAFKDSGKVLVGVYGNQNSAPANAVKLNKISQSDDDLTNIDLSKYNGTSCNYKSKATYGADQLIYNCRIIKGSPKCSISCKNTSNDGNECSYYTVNSTLHNINSDDFIINNRFSCPSAVYAYGSLNNQRMNISQVSTSRGGMTLEYDNNSSEDNGRNENGDFGDGNAGEFGNNGSSEGNFDPENFCVGNVLKSFRLIGWAIFVLKIAVPIIIIILGCIDLGKAIISSKDDEIKKAGKSLLFRAIAGIIIFFIPSVINIVIKLIGGENIYSESNGNFASCTVCMLDPSSKDCTNMIGGS